MRYRMYEFSKFFNGFTPVAELILLLTGHLGKSNFLSLWNEDRIIPEPRFSL